jgi:hypothetical protein
LATQTLEIEVPDGYKLIRYDYILPGEQYLNNEGEVVTWDSPERSLARHLRVAPIETRREPTTADLLNQSRIRCWVSDDPNGYWRQRELIGIDPLNDAKFITTTDCGTTVRWVYCEIVDRPPKGRIMYRLDYQDGSYGVFSDKNRIESAMSRGDARLSTFIEVIQ